MIAVLESPIPDYMWIEQNTLKEKMQKKAPFIKIASSYGFKRMPQFLIIDVKVAAHSSLTFFETTKPNRTRVMKVSPNIGKRGMNEHLIHLAMPVVAISSRMLCRLTTAFILRLHKSLRMDYGQAAHQRVPGALFLDFFLCEICAWACLQSS